MEIVKMTAVNDGSDVLPTSMQQEQSDSTPFHFCWVRLNIYWIVNYAVPSALHDNHHHHEQSCYVKIHYLNKLNYLSVQSK